MFIKKKIFFYLLFTLVFALLQCSQGQYKNTVTVDELYKKVQENPDIFILDVRTPKEYNNDGHLKGVKLIPVEELEKRLNEIKDKKNQDVYVICRSGSRSNYASHLLDSKGFKKVYNVKGGTLAWKRKKYPLGKDKI